jgi:hypothetical protein
VVLEFVICSCLTDGSHYCYRPGGSCLLLCCLAEGWVLSSSGTRRRSALVSGQICQIGNSCNYSILVYLACEIIAGAPGTETASMWLFTPHCSFVRSLRSLYSQSVFSGRMSSWPSMTTEITSVIFPPPSQTLSPLQKMKNPYIVCCTRYPNPEQTPPQA